MSPAVSIIIPVFNRSVELEAALASVARQTFKDWEAIVVDDRSSPDYLPSIERICTTYGARLVKQAVNGGPSAARNAGVAAAQGRYVAFLDSDDEWLPEKLARQFELVEAAANPERTICVTQTKVCLPYGRVRIRPERGPDPGEDWSEYLYLADGFAQTSSLFLSRALALQAPFDPSVRLHEDNLFFFKVGALGAGHCLVAEPLSVWRNGLEDDRTSRTKRYLERSRHFLEACGDLVTEKARLAFEVKYLGALLLRREPLAALKLFWRAAAQHAIDLRALAVIVLRVLLPTEAYEALRGKAPLRRMRSA